MGELTKNKVTVTYLDACPVPTQGICDNSLGRPMSAYFYNRTPEELARFKGGCNGGMFGTWRNG
ncbi:MAG TPA: hypothetical protein VIT92_09335 [Burkholderiaceae bacterium]